MFGATVRGVLHDYFPRFTDLMLSIDNLVVSGTYVDVPWSLSLEVLSVLLFSAGLAKAKFRYWFVKLFLRIHNENCAH